jgi:arylsulfatase A-like enzyme/cytochrome c-type biogenesis protein CcmH/NrfG
MRGAPGSSTGRRRCGARRLALALLASAAVPAAAAADPPFARNLLVLTFDTTRADHLSAYGGAARAPGLDRLAREGVRFDAAFAPTPITLPSHVSLFTGLYPTAHGVRNNGTQRLAEGAETLAERLRGHGFRTGAVVGSRVLDSRYGLDQGFETYDDRLPPEERVETLFIERRAAEVADLGLRWLGERGGERWFLWLHFFDPHWEYRPPEPYAARYRDAPYDGEIAYAADQAERVLARLRERGRLDETLVVATADHGESLGEHGESSHGIFVYDATMRVPLLLRHPARLGEGRAVASVVSLVDVLPTALAVLGLPPEAGLHGRSLAAADADRLVWLESWMPRLSYGWSEIEAVRGADWKFIRAPRPELYDLARDPGELHDLAASEPGRAAAAARRLETTEASIAAASAPARERTLEPDERRRLESLGYLSPGGVPPATGADPKDKIGDFEAVQGAMRLVSGERWEEAIAALRALVDANPDSGYLRRHLAGALRAAGRGPEAIRELERCVRAQPEDFGLHAEIGAAYLALGDLDAAEAALRAALRLNEHVAEAWHNLGLVAQGRGRADEAAGHYERALAEDPNLLRSLVNLGTLREQAGRTDEAIRLYLRIAELDPGNARAFFSAGHLLFQAGRHEEALAVLDGARRADPTSPLPHLYRAQILRKQGDLDAAERELREALALDPDSDEVRRALAAIERERGRGAGPPAAPPAPGA